VTDFSLEARFNDLTAIVDSLEAPSVDLVAIAGAGPVAISYAARHPRRTDHLILVDAIARTRDLLSGPRQRALRHLLEVDWDLYVQTQVLVFFGFTELAREVAQAVTDGISAEMFLAGMRAARDDDATELLSQVRCPTLVIHNKGEQLVSVNTVRRLAATIPNARLTQIDEQHSLSLAQDTAVRAMEAFLEEDEDAARRDQTPSGTAVILFADIVDSTALTERLGDAPFRTKARDLDAALLTVIREHIGTPIEGKLLGDGVLAVFTSARQAIEAALAYATAGNEGELPLHLGLHAGDVIREDNNVYGGAVNIASRISGLSAPGEVLVSDTVRSLARTSAGVSFEDRGEQSLKGVGEAARMWTVRSRDSEADTKQT